MQLYRLGALCYLLALYLLTSCIPAMQFSRVAALPPVLDSPTPSPTAVEEVLIQGTPADVASSQILEAAGFLPTEAPDALEQPAPDAAAAQVPEVNPLTGLPPHDPDLLNRRPLAIKISNYPRAIRPQYGLNEADVVYEYYIEWLNTRFIGIFYGNDARQIGPVRSGRYFDEHITRMYHAYYVFNFADPREYSYYLGSDLERFMVVPGYTSCPPFFEHKFGSRTSDVRHYEMYFDSSRFSDCLARKNADNSRQALRAGHFSRARPVDAIPVERIFTHYSKCDYNYWEYDAASQVYLRHQETSKSKDPAHRDDCVDTPETYARLVDALTGKQVTADNVVEIYVSHTFNKQDEQDDEIYHINLIDQGKAYVFRDGVALPALWVRTDIDQPLLLTHASGAPIELKPGRTFYQVIGVTSTEWSDQADWHFDFSTP